MLKKCLHIDSPTALRKITSQWNHLWQRGQLSQSNSRLEFVTDWCEQFVAAKRMQALVVADGDRFQAALPFVQGAWQGVIPCAQLPSNDWGLCGDLLLDEADPQAIDLLAQGLAMLPWPLVCFNDALLDEPRWQHFVDALARAAIPHDIAAQLNIARLPIDHDWQGYRATWSKGHRKHLDRDFRRLPGHGAVRLEWMTPHDADEAVETLARGLAIEKRGWKGKAASAALDLPHCHAWLCKQVRHLTALGQARFGFLLVGEREVAFEYGWQSKGVYYSFKIAYDDEFKDLGPGQLLTMLVLEQLFANPESCAFDFLSPINQSIAHWRPATYRVGKILAAPRGVASRALIAAQRHVLRPLRTWWRGRSSASSHSPAAATSA